MDKDYMRNYMMYVSTLTDEELNKEYSKCIMYHLTEKKKKCEQELKFRNGLKAK